VKLNIYIFFRNGLIVLLLNIKYSSPISSFLSSRDLSVYPRYLSAYPRYLSVYPRYLSVYPRYLFVYPRYLSDYPRYLSVYPIYLSVYPRYLSAYPRYLSVYPRYFLNYKFDVYIFFSFLNYKISSCQYGRLIRRNIHAAFKNILFKYRCNVLPIVSKYKKNMENYRAEILVEQGDLWCQISVKYRAISRQ
jgi:hypothetical protein